MSNRARHVIVSSCCQMSVRDHDISLSWDYKAIVRLYSVINTRWTTSCLLESYLCAEKSFPPSFIRLYLNWFQSMRVHGFIQHLRSFNICPARLFTDITGFVKRCPWILGRCQTQAAKKKNKDNLVISCFQESHASFHWCTQKSNIPCLLQRIWSFPVFSSLPSPQSFSSFWFACSCFCSCSSLVLLQPTASPKSSPIT